MSKEEVYDPPKRPGWKLYSELVEIYWKRGPKGWFADRVRIHGVTFYYISGKKVREKRR